MPRYAAIQMQPTLLDPEANLAKVATWIREAHARGAQVVVFPECVLTGYALSAAEADAIAEPVPGLRTARLADACRDQDMLAVVGTIEADEEGRCFNTAVLLGPQGVLGRYRKAHLPFLGVDRFLAAGDAIGPPIETSAGRLGLLICYDLRLPEPARLLALAGAQALLLPTAWPASARLYPEFLARARAAENGLYLIAANRIGEERGTQYLGRSLIAGPDGEMLAEATPDQEQMLIADIDPARSDQKKRVFSPGEYELDLIGDRRPDLYAPLASQDDR
jgi:predicted amidohydrolase